MERMPSQDCVSKEAAFLQVLALLFDTVSSHYRMTILHQKMCQGMRVTLDALQVCPRETYKFFCTAAFRVIVVVYLPMGNCFACD